MLNDYLATFITPERRERMRTVLALRQRYITVVLEDIFQPHNASAVLRSCDAFGVQDVHIIENRNTCRITPDVELGSAQWLSIRKYKEKKNNTVQALKTLKTRGYRLAAASLQAKQSLEELTLERGPLALLFGTEMTGLSQPALDAADETFSIPMRGFIESFNISVAAAITLYSLTKRLQASHIEWELSHGEKEDIRTQWLRSSIKKSDILVKEFFERYA
ncbi:MAG: TrmH family RNA methyltransferase [Salinispira sp.]